MKLVFATHNKNKAKEIQQLTGNDFQILTLDDLGCKDEIIEDGITLEENANIKSDYISNKYKLNCFADDTGLLVEALNDQPGVHSARYAGEQKNADDNMNLLLSKLKNKSTRKAKFITVISLKINDEKYFFKGELNGKIIEEKRGENGFGYDPIFMPDGYLITLAQMNLSEKNKISHRAIAFNKLIKFLKKEI